MMGWQVNPVSRIGVGVDHLPLLQLRDVAISQRSLIWPTCTNIFSFISELHPATNQLYCSDVEHQTEAERSAEDQGD